MDGIKILNNGIVRGILLIIVVFGFCCIDDTPTNPDYVDEDSNLRRGVWTMASPPYPKEVAAVNKLIWYNPYDPIEIPDIWPDSSVIDTTDDAQTALVLEYGPLDVLDINSSSWCGIMRVLSEFEDTFEYDYLNLWITIDTVDAISDFYMYVDIGDISEDINYNGRLDTEDRNYNGYFESDEDTGLDTLTDAQELAVITDPVYPDDPSGDNWYYSDDYDYEFINGTEGNRLDPEREYDPDTEDINNNGTLDTENSYFEYIIDLNNSAYIQEVTGTDWVNLRIPLRDEAAYEIVGNASFDNLNYIRFWLPVDENRVKIKIAVLELE